jgi:hypothetical protein
VTEEKRKAKNEDLIRRMRAGESLALVKQTDTWFQPRPIIQKDQEAIKKLFGNEARNG